MPVALTCECGKSLRVRTVLAGRKVRCPVCREVQIVPGAAEGIEEQALDILLSGQPAVTRPTATVTATRTPVNGLTPLPPTRSFRGPNIVWKAKNAPARPSSAGDDDAFTTVNGRIVGGTLLSVLALGWYASGYAVGYLVAGPIALLALGLMIARRGVFTE